MHNRQGWSRWLRGAAQVAILGSFALSSTGCLLVAGGAAASGAAGYAYYKGNVAETYEADFLTVWHASHDALYDLGMPIQQESKQDTAGTIESMTGKGDKVRLHVEVQPPATANAPRTQVGVRIATFGDEELSRRILQQIAKRATPAKVETTSASTAAPAQPVSSWKDNALPPPPSSNQPPSKEQNKPDAADVAGKQP